MLIDDSFIPVQVVVAVVVCATFSSLRNVLFFENVTWTKPCVTKTDSKKQQQLEQDDKKIFLSVKNYFFATN